MRRHIPQDYEVVFAELNQANDRAAILVAVSLLDHALSEAIMSRLREPPTDAGWAELFDDAGFLSTFSRKIMAAYFLKVIGPLTRKDFDIIRKIRNDAAHDMNPITFDAMKNRIQNLHGGFENAAQLELSMRQHFLGACKFYVANLILRTGDSSAEIVEISGRLAPYLNR